MKNTLSEAPVSIDQSFEVTVRGRLELSHFYREANVPMRAMSYTCR